MFIPFISFNLRHPLNINAISVTLDVLKFDNSKYSNSLQFWNIAFILVTLIVLNLLIPFISFNLWLWLNINDILVTLEVLKLDKSKYSNSLQFWNIDCILVTLIVLKLRHSLNINAISVTLEVLKLDISKYSNSVQFWNITFILVTLIVIKLLIPFISFNLWHWLNIHLISVTLEVLKFVKSKYSNSPQFWNIPLIVVTFSVLNLLIPFISFNL